MAPRSLSQFEPFDSQRPDDLSPQDTGSEEHPSEFSVISSFSRSGNDSSPSPEDPALQEMIEEARRATGASAAALALRKGDEIVCRAATGASAPPLDAPLNMDSGLSGACMKSRTFQRCDDSEVDDRVDAALCRRMGIRSILVFPIVLQDELLGIVEVFSPKPSAFADIHALQSLSRLVANKLVDLTQSAIQFEAPQQPRIDPAEEPAPDIFLPSEDLESPLPEPDPPQQDYWTPVLTFMVIALAIALVGLIGIDVQHASRATTKKATRKTTPTVATTAVQTQPLPDSATYASLPAVPTETPSVAAPTPKTKIEKPDTPSSSDLVISENGKVIYRQPAAAAAQTSSAFPSPGTAQPGGKPATSISTGVANQYVTHRVEPEYPEQARARHVQGPVTLQVTVDKNGTVKSLQTLRGDPQLAAAAIRAVQQWQFKPVTQNGQPAEFQTDVTVIFRLP